MGINPKLLKRYLQGKSALVVGDRSLVFFLHRRKVVASGPFGPDLSDLFFCQNKNGVGKKKRCEIFVMPLISSLTIYTDHINIYIYVFMPGISC